METTIKNLWYWDDQRFVVLRGDVAHYIEILQHDGNRIFHIVRGFPLNEWSKPCDND